MANDSSTPAGADAQDTSKDGSWQLGRYKVSHKIGAGAMGEVWYGLHPGLNIPVAIKILFEDLMGRDPTFLKRFVEEAHTAAKINHPNVVRIYDAGSEGRTHYIAMEYVAGGTARELMERAGGVLPLADAVSVVAGATRGLQAAARHNIIHRDIKPENIMISEDGTPKLADLGLAKQTGTASTGHSLTMTAVPMGTPFYIPPEQVLSAKEVDARADIYALGIAFYHLVTGEVPFTGDTAFNIMLKQVNEPLPDPRSRNPSLPDDICRIICRMAEKDPADRFQSADELLQALLPFLPPGEAAVEAVTPRAAVRMQTPAPVPVQTVTQTPPRSGIVPAASPAGVADPAAILARGSVTGQMSVAQVCPECGAPIAGTGDFCGRCGAVLRRPCPECGAKRDRDLVFCQSCGTDVPQFVKVQKGVKQIEKCAAAKKWQEIDQILEGIPKKLRLPGAKGTKLREKLAALHEQAEKQLKVSRELREAIDELVMAQDYDLAGEKLNQYLEINPHDDETAKMQGEIQTLKSIGLYRLGYQDVRKAMAEKRFLEADERMKELQKLRSDLPDPESCDLEVFDEEGNAVHRSLAELIKGFEEWEGRLASLTKEVERLTNAATKAVGEGDLGKTEKLLRDADALYPDHPLTQAAKKAFEKGKNKRDEAQELLEEVTQCEERADFGKARELLAKIKEAYANFSEVERAEGKLKKTSTAYTRQIGVAERAIEDRDLFLAYAAATFAQKLCKNSREAAQLVKSIESEQRQAITYKDDAARALDAAQFDTARSYLEKAAETWPKLSEIPPLSKRLASAEVAYEEAITEALDTMKRKQMVAAGDACRRALVICPESREAKQMARDAEKARKAGKIPDWDFDREKEKERQEKERKKEEAERLKREAKERKRREKEAKGKKGKGKKGNKGKDETQSFTDTPLGKAVVVTVCILVIVGMVVFLLTREPP